MLKLELMGNLGADPERRYTQDGRMMVSFRVAVNSKNARTNEEKTTWFRVTAFGDGEGGSTWLTDRIEKLLKGDSVYVRGTLDVSDFERQDGSKGTSLDVRFIDTLFKIDWMRDPRTSNAGDGDAPAAPSTHRERAASGTRAPAARKAPERIPDSDLEDLPF